VIRLHTGPTTEQELWIALLEVKRRKDTSIHELYSELMRWAILKLLSNMWGNNILQEQNTGIVANISERFKRIMWKLGVQRKTCRSTGKIYVNILRKRLCVFIYMY
jgi:hypothetical protein